MSAQRARARRRVKGMRWARERLWKQWVANSEASVWVDYWGFYARYPWLPAPVDAYATLITWYGNVMVMP